jgi:deoxyribose-phosphate aldolase
VISLASYIDHTILKPTTTHIDIKKICKEAVEYGFAAVCVPPPLVTVAVDGVKGAPANVRKGGTEAAVKGGETEAVVKVATVIGFPFGYSTTAAKLAEVERAIADKADELDIVINLVRLREGRWPELEEEMALLTARVHDAGKIVKVIIESGILSDEEIIRCCRIYSRVGVDFLKTSTGYAEKGASVEAVQLMRQHLPAGIRIKASGGIRDAAFARQLIAAGADRLGCSASVAIMKQEEASRKADEVSGSADYY